MLVLNLFLFLLQKSLRRYDPHRYVLTVMERLREVGSKQGRVFKKNCMTRVTLELRSPFQDFYNLDKPAGANKDFSCRYCRVIDSGYFRGFTSKIQFFVHILRFHYSMFVCLLCFRIESRGDYMDCHMRVDHVNSVVKCLACDEWLYGDGNGAGAHRPFCLNGLDVSIQKFNFRDNRAFE